jgi:hypothetical protein
MAMLVITRWYIIYIYYKPTIMGYPYLWIYIYIYMDKCCRWIIFFIMLLFLASSCGTTDGNGIGGIIRKRGRVVIVMGIPLDRWMVYSMENPNLNWMISGCHWNFRKPPFVQIIDDPHFVSCLLRSKIRVSFIGWLNNHRQMEIKKTITGWG